MFDKSKIEIISKNIEELENKIDKVSEELSKEADKRKQIYIDSFLEDKILTNSHWQMNYYDDRIDLKCISNYEKIVEFHNIYFNSNNCIRLEIYPDIVLLLDMGKNNICNYQIHCFNVDVFPNFIKKHSLIIDASNLINIIKKETEKLIKLEKLCHQLNVL